MALSANNLVQMLTVKGAMRNLALLAMATLVSLLAAIYGVTTREAASQPVFTPRLMFEGLGDRLNDVSKIVYTIGRGSQGVGTVVLARQEDGTWTVDERSHYPADFKRVKQTIVGMSELEAYELRTARPEWHHHLGLIAPEDQGNATRIELFDAAGEPMAALLAGKAQDSQGGQAAGDLSFIYARRDGENQAWLARGRLLMDAAAQDWLNPDLADISRERIRRAVLWAETDGAVIMSRVSAEERDFVLDNPPQGRETRGAPIINVSAAAIVHLTFEDVVPEERLDFPATSPQAIYETFDGLRVRVTMTGGGGGLWAMLHAEADPALAPEGADLGAVEAEAAAINARTQGWAYKLPQAVGGQMTQTMELLTREATGAAVN